MEKQGFSIIELMVALVIMGVLAAVAVPKLFGMIDKSKAAEISLAAGTYIKLQDIYSFEHHKGGSWQAIGYKSPAGNSTGKARTSVFEYDHIQLVRRIHRKFERMPQRQNMVCQLQARDKQPRHLLGIIRRRDKLQRSVNPQIQQLKHNRHSHHIRRRDGII